MSSLYVDQMATQGSQSLGSPLDVQWIVEQLIYEKQQPIRDLETYQTFYEAKKTAFQELNTKVSSLETALYNLNTSGFEAKTTLLSQDDYFSASAGSTAETGDFYIKVRQLATAQSDSSAAAGITDPDELVLSDGETFTIEQGDETVDIDITGGTRSLSGLKNAINSSDLDVTATVINDGTDYHLQITSNETGTDSGFTVTDTDVGTSMSNKISAQNALININTEDAGDAISRSSNTITDVIQGVTLNLLEADTSKTTTLSINYDGTNLKSNIQDFVDKFNGLKDFLNEQFAYDESTGQAGILSGEAAARKVQTDILNAVTSRVQGYADGEEYTSIFGIGIEMDTDGSLSINDSVLDEAIDNNLEAIRRIFKNVGTSDDPDIQYIGKSNDTVAGTYAINITQVAEEATVEGDSDVGTLSADEILTLTYNSTDYTVNLTTGMDIDAVVLAINDEMGEENVGITASTNGDRLVLTTESSGSSQSIAVVSTGTGVGFNTEHSDTGQDVVGTIGGNTANGEGNVLTGTEGDSNGLMVYISASTTGDKGDLYITFGVGESLRGKAEDLSYPTIGLIAKNIEAMDNHLETISGQIEQINDRLAEEQALLIEQFTAANQALVELQYLQSSLDNSLKT